MPGVVAALLRTTTGEIGLLLLSALLFALAHPSLLSRWGVGPLAFVALAPVFLVLRRAGWLRVVLYGVLYGYASYALYNYWLATFHPLAIIIVPVVYMGYLLVLFLLLKLADQFFPRYGYLVQILVWVGYEFVKSLGFLGYSYGILGYTQYLWTDFIQLAGVTGVWGVSLLVIAPSALLARWALEALEARSAPWRRALLARFWARHRVPILGLALLLAANVVYGAAARGDYQAVRQWRVALVQQNIDPWRGGFYAYERSLEILLRLSDAALREDPDIVIWSETSFVPGIDWHTRHRTDSRRYAPGTGVARLPRPAERAVRGGERRRPTGAHRRRRGAGGLQRGDHVPRGARSWTPTARSTWCPSPRAFRSSASSRASTAG